MLDIATYINIYLDLIKYKFSKWIPFKYYFIEMNEKNLDFKILDVSILINLLKIFNISNNKIAHKLVNRAFGINLDNRIIRKNNEDQILFDDKQRLFPVIPKHVIQSIRLDIVNHRYYLNNLKQNLFKIDRETPILFCLLLLNIY